MQYKYKSFISLSSILDVKCCHRLLYSGNVTLRSFVKSFTTVIKLLGISIEVSIIYYEYNLFNYFLII